MNRDQAIAKIKKCLALGKSANEHEAAAALRQAQALMREHGLSGVDVELTDVSEARARARMVALNRWEAQLSRVVAEAFGCDVFSVKGDRLIGRAWRAYREFVFVGVSGAAQVASYAYDVLARQCAAARMAHIARQPKSCKPITKTARGDQFALGWVWGVSEMVEQFAGAQANRLLIEHYIADRHPTLRSVRPKDTSVGRNVRDLDLDAGFGAGKAVQLARGIGTAALPTLLSHQDAS